MISVSPFTSDGGSGLNETVQAEESPLALETGRFPEIEGTQSSTPLNSSEVETEGHPMESHQRAETSPRPITTQNLGNETTPSCRNPLGVSIPSTAPVPANPYRRPATHHSTVRSSAMANNQTTPTSTSSRAQTMSAIDGKITLKKGVIPAHTHRYTLSIKVITCHSDEEEQALIKE